MHYKDSTDEDEHCTQILTRQQVATSSGVVALIYPFCKGGRTASCDILGHFSRIFRHVASLDCCWALSRSRLHCGSPASSGSWAAVHFRVPIPAPWLEPG